VQHANREPSVPATQQQRKAKARARYQAYVQRQRAKSQRRKRRRVAISAVIGVLVVLAGGWWLSKVTSDDTGSSATASSTPTPTPPPTNDPKFTFDKAQQVLDPSKPATMVLDTNLGPIDIALDTKDAPKNSNSLAFLASKGYFDNTPCHRLTTQGIFVLQCGDRTGTGSGTPGYTTNDENLPKGGQNNYPKGTVAMAEPSGGKAGSQFFLVYKDTTLPADYTIVGQITDGLSVVQQVADAGVAKDSTNPGDGAPALPISITAATVKQDGA
jgi:peptidyl-prolyl cis-trans isomerase B (cyclophilin B)